MDFIYGFPADFPKLKTTDYVHLIKPDPPHASQVNLDHEDVLSKKRLKIASYSKWFSDDKTALFYYKNYFESIPYFDSPIGPNPDDSECFKVSFEHESRKSFYPNIVSLCTEEGLRWIFNPTGPTGLRGRGILEKWGVNHFFHLVITRWKKDAKYCACIHTRTMRPVLEALVFKCKDIQAKKMYGAEGYFLPNDPYLFGTDNMYDLCVTKLREIYPEIEDDIIEKVLISAKRVYHGYVDDKRNTDNAWIETQCFNLHDENEHLSQLEICNNNENYEWRIVDCDENYFTGLSRLVHRAAKYNGAHF